MTDLATRYAERYQRNDDANLEVESATVGRSNVDWWRTRHEAMAEAHREAARWHTSKALALAPAPDAPWVYPPAGEDAW